jgi:transposase-like protein
MDENPLANPDGDALDPDLKSTRKRVVLELLAEGSSICEAARGVGLDRSTVFRWRQHDPEFAQACRQALVANVEVLKREAERRALKGSDKLLMFLLCNYAPEQFSQAQKVEVHDAGGIAAQIVAARKRLHAQQDCPLA